VRAFQSFRMVTEAGPEASTASAGRSEMGIRRS
jgi:hypothetical protein